MEHQYNYIDRENLKSWDEILSQYHFILHASHVVWPSPMKGVARWNLE
jgi:hypothetical protein